MDATAGRNSRLSERINRIEISATLAVVNEAARMRGEGCDLVDFGAGEPHFATPQHIKDAAVAALEANFTRYTAVNGTLELREAIARRHATDFGTAYQPGEVIASTGGKLALFSAIQVLVDHGDEVIIPVPYWVSFKDIVQYAGGVPVMVETGEARGFKLTAELIERAITPRTRAIILNSPNNPSGAVFPPEEMRAIVRLAARRGIYVIADECYVYLDYTGRSFSAGSVEEAREHIVVIGSLSKTYAMTGWRLGYALGPARIVEAMQKLQSQSTSNATSFVQKAAVAAMNGTQQPLAEMKAEYVRLRDRIVSGLCGIEGIHCHKPEGAFYVYPNVKKLLGRGGITTAAELAQRLLREAHVVVVPGEAFGTREHIRMSYATSEGEIERGLQRLREFLARL